MFKKRENMNCQKICLLLSPYQDKECDEKTSSKIFAHLQKCEHCRKEYELLERTREEISELSIIKPQAHFNSTIMAKIQKTEKNRFSPIPSVIYSIIFILFFIMGVLVNKDMEPKSEEITISQLLLQGQDLKLKLFNDKAFDLLKNGGINEK